MLINANGSTYMDQYQPTHVGKCRGRKRRDYIKKKFSLYIDNWYVQIEADVHGPINVLFMQCINFFADGYEDTL